MKNLWISLPAYAPDYSGICSAFFDLGGISVIHDASGCTGNYTGYDEPRWFGSGAKVFCSGLREIDAVMGDDEKLLNNTIRAGSLFPPSVYAVIGSPVPMVIGSDMRGIARELEERTGVPAFGFPANGLRLYDRGISDALCALIRRFAKPAGSVIPRGVNLLGTNPLDLGAGKNAADLEEALSAGGFTVVGKMMIGASLEQVAALSRAQVNLVVTVSGFNAAKLLWELYGIPYVVGMPLAGCDDVFSALEATLLDGQCRVIRDDAGDGVLIVGEQVIADSLRRAIRNRAPQLGVTVASMTAFEDELAGKGDLAVPEEEQIIDLLESGRFHTLIGDPVFGDILPDHMRLISMPHPALSSRLYWDEVPAFLGTGMKELVKLTVDGSIPDEHRLSF